MNPHTDHRPTDHTVTKETTRMSLLSRFVHRLSPFSFSAATTPAGRGDAATRAAAMASGGPSEARTQGGGVAALLTRLRTQHRAVSAAVSVVAVLGTGASIAATPAQAESPWWHLTQRVITSEIAPGGEGKILLQAINLGNQPTVGTSTITAELPPHIGLLEEGGQPAVSFFASSKDEPLDVAALCTVEGRRVSCQTEPTAAFFTKLFSELPPEFSEPPLREFIEESKKTEFGIPPLNPYEFIEMKLGVEAEVGATASEPVALGASGGAAADAAITRPVPVGTVPVPYGLEHFALTPEEEGGQTATHAGSHPYQLTTDVAFNRSDKNSFRAPAPPRNLHFALPPGQLGNATTAPKCSDAAFVTNTIAGPNLCPADTVIGATLLTFSTAPRVEEHLAVPIFNLEPAPGEPARFGFEALANPVILDTHLRSGPGEDYGVTVDVPNTTELVSFLAATNVFWGAPAAASHDNARGWGCINGEKYLHEGSTSQPCQPSNNPRPPAFLTLPTDCAAPFAPGFSGNSWPTQAAPGGFEATPLSSPLADEAGDPLGLTACNQVPFNPEIAAEPTSDAATSPTGLNFSIGFHDEGLLNAEGVAQSQIKKAVVALPQGFTTNPSVAEGLKACSRAEYEESSLDGSRGCTPESKVGDVLIESPLVEEKVLGSLFVARQGENPNPTPQNPSGNLLTIYLVARNAKLGVLIKQALRVTPDPLTGRLTTEVDSVPELPFSHFELSFRQGQRSPLVTPPTCGTYTVNADLYPWARPSEAVHRESSFQITQGPEGQGCPSGGTPPFHPVLEAGTINNAAGTYSPFVTHITRKDSEQEITRFSIKLPPGVAGKLAGVSECSDAGIAQAKSREVEGGGSVEENNPSCPKNSEVGHSLVGSGVGNVLAYAPGKLYLAGPYHGSNISLVSITAAKVGPFDLGTVVVRFALKIDPETAEVSVDGATSDPIPHIVDGIPVHLRDIRAYVDRPNFTYNPTSCAKKSTASTILGSGLNFASSADDQPVTVTSPFQAADCASLGFKPKLALSLKGGTKRGKTPAFKAVLTYPKKGAYANVAKSVVTLPHSEFLEQAHIGTVCTRVQFKEGTTPGEKCPKASIYGKARAVTPILDEPLEGPVYLRSSSHNLPDLVAALHNKQVDIALDGRIDSVKNGRIRNTFEAVPDAPVSKFVLEMKGGKKGLLVNSTNLCARKNRAISEFTGQNGKLYNTNPVLSAKCSKGKKHKKHGKH